MHDSPWLMRAPGPARRIQLFCFPYAGGAAGRFLQWQASLSPDIANEAPKESPAFVLEALGCACCAGPGEAADEAMTATTSAASMSNRSIG